MKWLAQAGHFSCPGQTKRASRDDSKNIRCRGRACVTETLPGTTTSGIYAGFRGLWRNQKNPELDRPFTPKFAPSPINFACPIQTRTEVAFRLQQGRNCSRETRHKPNYFDGFDKQKSERYSLAITHHTCHREERSDVAIQFTAHSRPIFGSSPTSGAT